MRYCLIGCGRISVNHIKAAIDNDLEIAALCDIDPLHANGLIEKFSLENVAIYEDYITMLDEVRPELVAIATHSSAHARIAIECIKRKIPVIIEKPIALHMSDANEIIRLSKGLGVPVCACHQNRFNQAVASMYEAVKNKRFGKISHGSIHVRWNRGKQYYDQASWRGTLEHDGGALMNQCIHGIDMLRWFMGGQVVSVRGIVRNQYHDFIEAEDIGLALLEFSDGSIATIEGTVNVFPSNLEETLYLFGQKGTAKLGGKSMNSIDVWNFEDLNATDETIRSIDEKTTNVYGNGHTPLYRDMISAIEQKRTPMIDATAGRDALELVLAIYKSALTGEKVDLPLCDFGTLDMVGYQYKRN